MAELRERFPCQIVDFGLATIASILSHGRNYKNCKRRAGQEVDVKWVVVEKGIVW